MPAAAAAVDEPFGYDDVTGTALDGADDEPEEKEGEAAAVAHGLSCRLMSILMGRDPAAPGLRW